ncbi:hypothetical protein M407DRAFT_246369 [Tulasnella calospora MUT 4182]|uniref:Uncharacterized protein n=1 Tax=Tulasnella calospora MUT 4182 TaxID=1051891 RepID=A0A0C3KBR5_9AGAM|nr:hypothetical protein M407DRAFT_246369 [Tulasnella calospora MUT 4182]
MISVKVTVPATQQLPTSICLIGHCVSHRPDNSISLCTDTNKAPDRGLSGQGSLHSLIRGSGKRHRTGPWHEYKPL